MFTRLKQYTLLAASVVSLQGTYAAEVGVNASGRAFFNGMPGRVEAGAKTEHLFGGVRYVLEAPHGSLAGNLGLDRGDVITHVNGTDVTTLPTLDGEFPHDGLVTLRVRRAGKTYDVSARLRAELHNRKVTYAVAALNWKVLEE